MLGRQRRFICAAALLLGLTSSPPSAADNVVLPWSDLVQQAAGNPALEARRTALVAQARESAAQPIIRRPYTLADVGTHRTWLDGRSEILEPEIRETFALAMSDFAACSALAKELPVMAAGYRLTNDAALLARIVEQLEEVTRWMPLQRPGWTLYAPGNRLSDEGKDGNWLATGMGVRALGDTLDLLPDESLEPDLVARLHALLEGEIAGVVDDWATKRSWFIRSDNAITNQWMLPTEGLVRAALILGVDEHRDAYELGVANFMRALDAHGAHGEFEEGFGYAQFTVSSMLHTAHAMAVAGDRRGIDHPFLANFPTWLIHHFQPGEMVVNCFDAGGSYKAANSSAPLLTLAALCTGSPPARWALTELLGGPSEDLAGLAVGAMPPVGSEAAPPLYAAYERACRVNWRSHWGTDASGVWVRGGHALDQHDHQDRGHVNFIADGRPILIEAGTPSYDHSRMGSHYSSGVGHNVLQIGTADPDAAVDPGHEVWQPGWQKRGGVAPIAVQRLEQSGGEVTVDASACYDGLARWERRVTWDTGTVTVTDDAALAEGTSDVLLFRWHLGTDIDVTFAEEGGEYRVVWPSARIVITADVPLTLTQTRLPDHTLAGHDGSEDAKNHHTCVVVQTQAPANAVHVSTRVEAEPAPE